MSEESATSIPKYERLEWEDIGHGIRIRRVVETTTGELEAIDWDHECPVFKIPDYIPLKAAEFGWQVESAQPLTLSPSLLCRACQRHGHIRGGAWQPC